MPQTLATSPVGPKVSTGGRSFDRMNFQLITRRNQGNSKIGDAHSMATAQDTCPAACPFYQHGGGYCAGFRLQKNWEALTAGKRGIPWHQARKQINQIPEGELLRLFTVGDCPHTNGRISRRWLRQLAEAVNESGCRAYGYTHHDWRDPHNFREIRAAVKRGVHLNVSTHSEAAADEAIAAGLPAVVTVTADQLEAQGRNHWKTAGGNTVLICPHQTSGGETKCSNCELCAGTRKNDQRGRPAGMIIGFVIHGAAHKKATAAHHVAAKLNR